MDKFKTSIVAQEEWVELMELPKKTVVIFGATGGLGKDMLQYFEEYEVYGLGSNDADITAFEEVEEVINKFEPDVVINMAARSIDSTLLKTKDIDVSAQIEVNCIGNLNLIKAFTSFCRRTERKGCFIYFSSVLSIMPVAGAGIYSATKAFNDNLIVTAALENQTRGIRFNSIQFGYMGKGLCDRLPQVAKDVLLTKIPAGRFGTGNEVANAVKFLIETEYANGSHVKVTGGIEHV